MVPIIVHGGTQCTTIFCHRELIITSFSRFFLYHSRKGGNKKHKILLKRAVTKYASIVLIYDHKKRGFFFTLLYCFCGQQSTFSIHPNTARKICWKFNGVLNCFTVQGLQFPELLEKNVVKPSKFFVKLCLTGDIFFHQVARFGTTSWKIQWSSGSHCLLNFLLHYFVIGIFYRQLHNLPVGRVLSKRRAQWPW